MSNDPHASVPVYGPDEERRETPLRVERANYGPDADGPAAYLSFETAGIWLDAEGTREVYETLAQIIGVSAYGKPGPVIYAEGDALIVTGDEGDYDHGFEPGQAVTVRRYDASDNTYRVSATGGGDDDDGYGKWISADDLAPMIDLTPEPEPEPEPEPVLLVNPAAEALRRYTASLMASDAPLAVGDLVRYNGGGMMAAQPGAIAEVTKIRPGSDLIEVAWRPSDSRRNGQHDGAYFRKHFTRTDGGEGSRPIRGGDTVEILADLPLGADLRRGDVVVVRSVTPNGDLLVNGVIGARRRSAPTRGWLVTRAHARRV